MLNKERKHVKDGTYFSLISFVRITPAAKVCREELLLGRLLCDDVVDWRFLRSWRNSVDGAKRQSEQSTTISLCELLRKLLCELYSLVLNLEATKIHNIGAYITAC